jgi:hypothetical protein
MYRPDVAVAGTAHDARIDQPVPWHSWIVSSWLEIS